MKTKLMTNLASKTTEGTQRLSQATAERAGL